MLKTNKLLIEKSKDLTYDEKRQLNIYIDYDEDEI